MSQLKAYKLKNPYRLDQEIKQTVHISSDDLVLDYSNSPWVAMDTEYLSFNRLQDRLCTIQIASKAEPTADEIRVEILYVFKSQAGEKLKALLQNEKIEKLFHVFSSDMPRIEDYAKVRIKGKIFDTKVAAKITWTNTQNHGMKNLLKMYVNPTFEQKDTELLADWEVGPEKWSDDQVYYMMQDVIYLDVLRHRILEMAGRRDKLIIIDEVMGILPTISELYRKGYSESVLAY
jgi:ribonuclease D